MTSQIPRVKEVIKMNEMLAYSIHLGNDKNKTKKAKEIAKNNQSNTTSFSNNSIQNKTQLSKANNHNLRKYDNATEELCIIYGTNNLVNDVQNLYMQEFENSRTEYNEKQTREDRKIQNYFEHISKNSNRDLACELIIELGDMNFWQDKTQDYRYKMVQVYKEQIQDLISIVPQFKIANAVIHFDETSPHLHIIGVPVKENYKNGMKKQVAKSQIFTKESLTKIQDKMRNCCIKSFNKVYEQDYQLKEKQKGRNQDISVSKMQNYNELKKQQESNKKKLQEANRRTDLVNTKGENVEEIIKNLKLNFGSKKNYTISKENLDDIKQYITDVKDTTKSIKNVNDLDIIMKEYEKDLKEHNNEVRQLNITINNQNYEINELKEDLNIAKDTISKQQKEINILKPFKFLWNNFMKFFKNRVRYYKDESYKRIYEQMKENKVLRKEDVDYIDNKNGKKRNYEL